MAHTEKRQPGREFRQGNYGRAAAWPPSFELFLCVFDLVSLRELFVLRR
jgi:hypothetical protein